MPDPDELLASSPLLVLGRRRWVAGIAAAALTLMLAACSRYAPPHTAADVAESRDEVRAAATEMFPALAGALGGRIVAASGKFNLGGDGMVNRQQYQASVVIEDPWTTADEVAAAVEALGFDVVQEPDPDNPDWPTRSERGTLTLTISSGLPPVTASIRGPYFTLPMEDRPPLLAHESLNLPGFADLPLESDGARGYVRAVAARDLPALAESLGGTITAAQGHYVAGGDHEFSYDAQVVIEGSRSVDTQIAEALEALGWRDVEVDDAGVTGTTGRDMPLTLTTTGGPSPLLVQLSFDVPSVTVRATASLDSEGLFLAGIDVPRPEPDLSRERVRQEATRDVPTLAALLGGTITTAEGQYVAGEADAFAYEVTVMIDDSESTDAQIAEALGALGWQDLEVDDSGVTGHDGALTVATTSGPSPFLVVIRSDLTTLDIWNTAGINREDLFPSGTGGS